MHQCPTRKQIAEIAAATKRYCSANGMGNVINVWPDGRWTSEASTNSAMEITYADGSRTERAFCIRWPATRAQVAEICAKHTALMSR